MHLEAGVKLGGLPALGAGGDKRLTELAPLRQHPLPEMSTRLPAKPFALQFLVVFIHLTEALGWWLCVHCADPLTFLLPRVTSSSS